MRQRRGRSAPLAVIVRNSELENEPDAGADGATSRQTSSSLGFLISILLSVDIVGLKSSRSWRKSRTPNVTTNMP